MLRFEKPCCMMKTSMRLLLLCALVCLLASPSRYARSRDAKLLAPSPAEARGMQGEPFFCTAPRGAVPVVLDNRGLLAAARRYRPLAPLLVPAAGLRGTVALCWQRCAAHSGRLAGRHGLLRFAGVPGRPPSGPTQLRANCPPHRRRLPPVAAAHRSPPLQGDGRGGRPQRRAA